jgi:hypothetical protein
MPHLIGNLGASTTVRDLRGGIGLFVIERGGLTRTRSSASA